jgi:F-type H+-transporting ATPase subunit alpha
LEAFAKFGSDLDASTKLTIDRGRKNLEILKQPVGSPVPVEEQVAIIYVSTVGGLDNVPVGKIREFEKEYLAFLRAQHKDVLNDLRAGKLDDKITSTLKSVAVDLAKRY